MDAIMAEKKTYDEQRGRKKVPVGLRLDEDVLDQLRNAVFWIGQGLTVNGVAEEAISKALEALKAEHNGGKRFKARTRPLPHSRGE